MKNASKSRNAQRLIRFLSKNKKDISPLLILTHDFPDPDALASAYALQYLADTVFGIHTRIVYRGIIGRVENRNMVDILKLPVHKIKAGDLGKYTHTALVDTQPQFENNPFPEDRKATLVIDQHPSAAKPLAEFSIIDPQCGATSIILAQAILSLKVKITKKLATALVYGILADTLNLIRARRPDIIKTYLQLLPLCNIRDLARIQSPLYEKRYIATLGHAIYQARMHRGLVFCHLGHIQSPDMVSQIADFLLNYKETKWSFCTGRFKDKLHVSLRVAKSGVPAYRILRKCFTHPEDAGGHGGIAGGSFRIGKINKRQWKREENNLVDKLLQNLHLPKGGRFHYPFRSN